jgi:hypothetical protein
VFFLKIATYQSTPKILYEFLLFANAFLAFVHFVCVLAIYCQFAKILFPPLFSLSCVSLFEWFVPTYFFNVLNLVHVPPPPVITYLIIH